MAYPVLKLFLNKVDPYNGASLLGLRKIVIKAMVVLTKVSHFYAIAEG